MIAIPFEDPIEEEAAENAAELHDQGLSEDEIAGILHRPKDWVMQALEEHFECERREMAAFYGAAAVIN